MVILMIVINRQVPKIRNKTKNAPPLGKTSPPPDSLLVFFTLALNHNVLQLKKG